MLSLLKCLGCDFLFVARIPSVVHVAKDPKEDIVCMNQKHGGIKTLDEPRG